MSTPHGPLDLVAYDMDDRVLWAQVDLHDDRLLDLLVRDQPIPASGATVCDLRTRMFQDSPLREIRPGDLGIVVATGPRGSLRHRVETTVRPVRILVGRYVLHGYVHAPLDVDPLELLRHRPWIPLTEAVLEHHAAGRPWRERYDALLVNRAWTTALSTVDEATHETHWLAGGRPQTWPELVSA